MKTHTFSGTGRPLVVVAIGAIARAHPPQRYCCHLFFSPVSNDEFMMDGGHRHGGLDTDPTDIHHADTVVAIRTGAT